MTTTRKKILKKLAQYNKLKRHSENQREVIKSLYRRIDELNKFNREEMMIIERQDECSG